jgi:hypothetical protein
MMRRMKSKVLSMIDPWRRERWTFNAALQRSFRRAAKKRGFAGRFRL